MALEGDAKRPGFPARQLLILLTCRLVEPLAVTSIVPYLFPMVKYVAPALSDAQATRHVTLIFSAYSFAQFATNILWGRLSDKIGRRPVMLFGLAGILVSTLGLAFSTSIAAIFVFRTLAGLLSGNVVITRTMIGDMVHGRENKARAFAWNQTAYQIGYVVGPMVGGYLVQPCSQFPGICDRPPMTIFESLPFALPNLVISVLVAASFLIAYFFINETLNLTGYAAKGCISEESSLLQDSSPVDRSTSPALGPKVMHLVVSYAIMAMHTICFDQIFPVFLATREVQSTPPFRLNGGLGLSSPVVATFISASGVLSVVLMMTVFPPIDVYFGSLHCMRASLLLYPFTYFFLPYLAVLPQSPAWIRLVAVSAILAANKMASVFSFNDNAVLLNIVAPSPNALGLVNGIAQTAAAGARALGPALMGVFIGLGERIGTGALGWWFLGAVAVAGAIQGFWVVDDEEDEDVLDA
ncbi:hypothetical protein VTK73DRAFT_6596 [Phialemonium thermophilum]|uniref:Major facilitator superfamily (MFS) profile domain-containing protein n=1 Tax=Phialemonium thermophilum TaxID=223376 RepID=A0ABR3WJ80_9PEZI